MLTFSGWFLSQNQKEEATALIKKDIIILDVIRDKKDTDGTDDKKATFLDFFSICAMLQIYLNVWFTW